MDRPLLGIALFVVANMLFSLSDASAKYLTGSLPVIEIGWVRYVIFVLLAAGSPPVRKGPAGLATRRPWWQVARGLGIVGSTVFFIASLASLPIAEATAVNFVSPLMATVLSVVLLRERVTRGGWIAVAAGFLGVLIVVRPGSAGSHPAALLVLASSFCWVAAMLITRRISAVERPSVTLFWTAATGLVVLSLLLPMGFRTPTLSECGLALFLGVVASVGQWLVILAYRYAAVSILAPLGYGQLIWSGTLGYLVFGAVPDQWTLVGAVIIVGSGLYTVQRARTQPHLEARPAISSRAIG
jgi:drug/metabolite transporter (DMT)-like permease